MPTVRRMRSQEHIADRPASEGTTPTAEEIEFQTYAPKITWGAIFAGSFLALAVILFMNMLGLGIGAATVDPAQANGSPSVTAMSWGTAIWWIISGILAFFVGGFAASRLSATPSDKKRMGGWHGLTAWALTTLVLFYLMSSTIGAVAGGAYSVVTDGLNAAARIATTAVQTTGQAIGAAQLPDIDQQTWNQLQNQIGQELDQATGGLQVQEVRQAVIGVITALVSQDQSALQQAREEAVTIIMEVENLSRTQAQQQLDNYIQQVQGTYQNLVQQGQQTLGQVAETSAEYANQVANAVSAAAWYSVFALILSALAGWLGGMTGTPREKRTA